MSSPSSFFQAIVLKEPLRMEHTDVYKNINKNGKLLKRINSSPD
jgi:hypothetical protein